MAQTQQHLSRTAQQGTATVQSLQARLRRQGHVIAELRQRLREVEKALIPEIDFPPEWPLAAMEKQVFRALLGRDLVSQDELYRALYEGRDEPPASDVVQSHVSKVRTKLRPFGVEIVSKRYEGYRLEARLSWRAKLGLSHTPSTPASRNTESQNA